MVDSISSSSVEPELIARLCVEYWKLARASLRAAAQLNEKDGKRLAAQVKFSDLQLLTIAEQMGLSVVSFDGESFTAGLPASADNGEDYGEGAERVNDFETGGF